MPARRFGVSRGMTFVELLVVMVNLGIILAIAVPSFIGWVPRVSLKAAVRDLRSNFFLCKMKAIAENRDCVIEFRGDHYALAEEKIFLPDKGAVAFGCPTGVPPIPDGAEPGESGVTFPSNKAQFKSTGRPKQMGTVYLTNSEGRAYAVSVSIAGYVKVRHWEKGSWKTL